MGETRLLLGLFLSLKTLPISGALWNWGQALTNHPSLGSKGESTTNKLCALGLLISFSVPTSFDSGAKQGMCERL